jgi:hypothetical protein
MSNDLRKMFAEVLTQEQILDEQLFAMADEELAQLPADSPKHMRVAEALLRALERRIADTEDKQ